MSDSFPCIVLLLMVAGAVMWGIRWYGKSRWRQFEEAGRVVASAHYGQLIRGQWSDPPRVRIPYQQTALLVHLDRDAAGWRTTTATFDWPTFTTPVGILYSVGAVSQARSGTNAVPLHDDDWDRYFIVESPDPEYARRLLAGGVRAAVVMLSRIRRVGGLDIQFGGGGLRIRKRMVLDKPSELSAFVRHSLEIFDQALLAGSTGIEFVDHLQAQVLVDAKCPVCGDLITDQLVFCARCKSPHHRDCWAYNGKCATYACGETRFASPRIAGPR
jgi:hypothetical protein